jgi:RimJ/RimL family protein N-acetyltransferase
LLRPVQIADAPELFKGIVGSGLGDSVPGSEEVKSAADASNMVAGLIEKASAQDELHFSVCLQSGAVVGMCALYDFDAKTHSARIGYWISRGHRRSGYGKEAVRLLTQIAFSDLGLERLVAVSKMSNDASIGLLLSLGFKDAQSPHEGKAERTLFLARL